MVDYDDLDQNLKRKEELVEKAKQLAESDNLNDAQRKLASLRKEWKRFEDYESNFEEQLREKFEEYATAVKTKRDMLAATAVENKQAIIDKAKEAASLTNFKEATKQMDELMEEWKKSVSAGKEKDDELWNQFKEVRNEFFSRRKEYYADLTVKHAASKQAKTDIVAKAQELSTSTEWKKTSDELNELLEQWKAAGSAGKKVDEDLWKQFSSARKAFNSAKNAHFAQMKEEFAKRAVQKQDLIAQAKLCVAQVDFSNEMVEKVKSLRTQWKEIGTCGRNKEDALWNEFNETVNTFFKNMKDYK